MKTPKNPLNQLGLVQFSDIQNINPIPTYQTLAKWWKIGKFPKPTRLSHSCLCWKKSDIDQWLANQNGA